MWGWLRPTGVGREPRRLPVGLDEREVLMAVRIDLARSWRSCVGPRPMALAGTWIASPSTRSRRARTRLCSPSVHWPGSAMINRASACRCCWRSGISQELACVRVLRGATKPSRGPGASTPGAQPYRCAGMRDMLSPLDDRQDIREVVGPHGPVGSGSEAVPSRVVPEGVKVI